MRYVINVVKRSIMGQRIQRVQLDTGRLDIMYTMHKHPPAKCESFHDENGWPDLGPFIVDTKEEAEHLARWLASERPGHEVLVCEVQGIAEVEIGDPVMKKVTDKGVFPA